MTCNFCMIIEADLACDLGREQITRMCFAGSNRFVSVTPSFFAFNGMMIPRT
jgi:hypothetical protein